MRRARWLGVRSDGEAGDFFPALMRRARWPVGFGFPCCGVCVSLLWGLGFLAVGFVFPCCGGGGGFCKENLLRDVVD